MLHWILQFNYKARVQKLIKNKTALLIMLFYSFYLVGIAWTENIMEGKAQLLLKSSLFFFPLLFSTNDLFPKSKEKIFQAFIAGCILSAAICLGYAFYVLIVQHKNIFFYSQLSDVLHLHPAYIGVYILFASMLLMRKWIKKQMTKSEQWGTALLLLFFALYLVLLSARAQLIILVFMIPVFQFYKIKLKKDFKSKKLIRPIAISIGLLLLLIGAVFIFPLSRQRIVAIANDWNRVYSETDPSSIAERKVIWKSAIEVIKTNPVFGTGTGDSKTELVKKFNDNGWHLLAQRNFNSHNQFFEVAISLGIPAALFFVWLIFYLYKKARRQKQILLQGFVIIFTLSMLTEAMLESEAGIVFFVFIISMLSLKPVSNELESEIV